MGAVAQARVAEQGAEAVASDLAFADVGVAVGAGTQA